MISTIRPRSHKDYLALPILGKYLDGFTQWSHQRGYTIGTIRNQLRDTRRVIDFFLNESVKLDGELTHYDFEKA